jgi:hypothetical protein
MNILRTAQKEEDPKFIEYFFTSERPKEVPPGWKRFPSYPLRFPFPFKFKEDVEGGYLYIVYRGRIIGYGLIESVEPHQGLQVGSKPPCIGKNVKPGDVVVIKGPLTRMPFEIACRGFVNFRYIEDNLHELTFDSAQRVISKLDL